MKRIERRLNGAATVLVAAGMALVAGPAVAQTATIAVGAPVTSIDPHYHNLSPNNAVADIIFDRLVNNDPQSRNIPGLATEWRAIEPTVWEFKLRPNVRFRNGNPFTAEDVAFTRHIQTNIWASRRAFEHTARNDELTRAQDLRPAPR